MILNHNSVLSNKLDKNENHKCKKCGEPLSLNEVESKEDLCSNCKCCH